MKKRLISLFLLFAVTCGCMLSFASCGKKAENEIYFLNFKPEVGQIYEKIATDIFLCYTDHINNKDLR